ncbi:MAG: hypothetical protein KIH67_004570 [Candidatus Moranbacteria bacterium]|nr:hypothetical protein [Candidatus Moranbacteria bacterium]
MHRHATRGEIEAFQADKTRLFDELTERARQGDFGAFGERQKMLSRDPVDLGIEWQRFQGGT